MGRLYSYFKMGFEIVAGIEAVNFKVISWIIFWLQMG